ncbi:hypothetical protein KGY77_08080 [Candidatus Bipolaricaulota bacterium]|nr:hypothetical protein [Candidatus Bipolaricaulota bacterium]MBS3792583.1 hypothetical protein [Candidatus Bipolaricaulota bacterium]
MQIVYRIITIALTILVVRNTVEEEDLSRQAIGALVFIPLLLRSLMIK